MATSRLHRPFGHYTLVRRLANGGMAEVYLAKAESPSGFEKTVAIKRVHPHLTGTEQPQAALAEEAKLAVCLRHPNIVRTFDLGRADDADFIVMEHVEGFDLQHLLDALADQERRLPIAIAVHLVAEVCRGLHYAHTFRDAEGQPMGIVHRDISPQNILLGVSGEVKLTDFGIAKTMTRRSRSTGGVIKGKYYYMSPEQASGEHLDHRSDIFSAGVVLWELLAGRRLHYAPDVHTLLQAVRAAQIPAPSSLRPSVPTGLDAVVARATARKPDDRFDDAASMAQALERCLDWRPRSALVESLGGLLETIPAPEVVTRPPAPPVVPRTRDRATPPDATLRYALEDGRPTVAGLASPQPSVPGRRWDWLLAAGVALVGVAAWLLHGG
jgi:serine/threonine protein kinase